MLIAGFAAALWAINVEAITAPAINAAARRDLLRLDISTPCSEVCLARGGRRRGNTLRAEAAVRKAVLTVFSVAPHSRLIRESSLRLRPPPAPGAPSLGAMGRVILIAFCALAMTGTSVAVAADKVGTNRNDRIVGTNGNDRLKGKGGRDTLIGKGGRDVLIGDSGGDRLYGGRGRDTLLGGSSNDRLVGGPGRDVISCGAGRDTVVRTSGDSISSDCERITSG